MAEKNVYSNYLHWCKQTNCWEWKKCIKNEFVAVLYELTRKTEQFKVVRTNLKHNSFLMNGQVFWKILKTLSFFFTEKTVFWNKIFTNNSFLLNEQFLEQNIEEFFYWKDDFTERAISLNQYFSERLKKKQINFKGCKMWFSKEFFFFTNSLIYSAIDPCKLQRTRK